MRPTWRTTFSLAGLVVQNTTLVFSLKYSYRPDADAYIESTVLLCAEVLKFLCCSVLITSSHGIGAVRDALYELPSKTALALPSLSYVLQNYLLFQAVHILPPTVYVVCAQGKIITTAMFSSVLLGTKYKRVQLLSIAVLFVGITLVQVSANRHHAVVTTDRDLPMPRGLFYIFFACCTSGLTGVFLERSFKEPLSCIWTKNFHMCTFSVPVTFLSIALQVGGLRRGVFSGFDGIVIVVVILQALGGLLTAFTLRFASSLSKCFAVSMSICLCAVISAIAGQEQITLTSGVGIFLVNCAIFFFIR